MDVTDTKKKENRDAQVGEVTHQDRLEKFSGEFEKMHSAH
jgi:hypothetical protein